MIPNLDITDWQLALAFLPKSVLSCCLMNVNWLFPIQCIDNYVIFQTSSAQLLSHVQLFKIPWTAESLASLSFAISQSLLKLMSLGDAIQPSIPLSSPSPTLNLSQHQGQFFTSGCQSIGVSASASVLPMNIQD